ncbi:MAG: endonuclease III [Clostridia bacterium]|nr:endonuclease III [Clostridia bacterium]
MTKKKAKEIIDVLDILYPDARAELDYTNPYELLIAVILSAQCTDVRVNMVTKDLFELAPDAKSLLEIPIEVLENIIKPCGLYRTKAKNLHLTAEQLVVNWNGEVPNSHEALKTLPGVGQKTANVVVSNVFGIPAIAVDTHVFRVSNRLGLVKAKTVEETELQLQRIIEKTHWTKAHHQLIFHGRRVCKARNPNCSECALSALCDYYKKSVKE